MGASVGWHSMGPLTGPISQASTPFKTMAGAVDTTIVASRWVAGQLKEQRSFDVPIAPPLHAIPPRSTTGKPSSRRSLITAPTCRNLRLAIWRRYHRHQRSGRARVGDAGGPGWGVARWAARGGTGGSQLAANSEGSASSHVIRARSGRAWRAGQTLRGRSKPFQAPPVGRL